MHITMAATTTKVMVKVVDMVEVITTGKEMLSLKLILKPTTTIVNAPTKATDILRDTDTTRGLQTLRQILRHSTTTTITTTKAMGHLMVGAVVTTREMQKLSHTITMAIITTRAMEAAMEYPIEASMAMARGMQSLTQILRHSIMVIISNHMEGMVNPIGATMGMVRERLRLILRHSIITDTILRATGEVIVATMAMARGLLNLNLKLMLRPILRPSIIMAIIPRVMGEVTVIITPQSMGMGLPMAMARGMPRQKLKLSIP